MQVDVRSLVADFRREYGSGAAALRALGIKAVRRGGGIMSLDEAEPETMTQWLRRKGVSDAVIEEFRRRCEEGAEDEEEETEQDNTGEHSFNNTKLGDQLSRIDKFLRDKLQRDDIEAHRGMLDELLRQHNNGASDAIPSRGRNGMPRNALGGGGAMDEDRARRAAAHRHSQNCDLTLGRGTSAYGVSTDGVRFPGERKKPRSGAEKLPDTSHIGIGAV